MAEVLIIWAMRLGILFLVLGLILPSRFKKKTILTKALHRRPVIFENSKTSSLYKFLDEVTESPFLRPFMLKEDSDEYSRLERLIVQAGGLNGLTPNVVQLFRILLPAVSFIVMVCVYIVRLTVQTFNLNSSAGQSILEKTAEINSFLQPQITSTPQPPHFSFFAIAVMFFISLLFAFVPEMFINFKINARKEMMRKELPIIETFVVIMLETGAHTVYEILRTLCDTTNFFKPYLTVCLNEYYIDPKRAIQNMADKINDEEFQIVCNGLKQAVDVDKKYTATFMKQHLDQLKRLQGLHREATIKKKPLIFVLVLVLPMFGVIAIWFWPWFTNAMKILQFTF